VPALHNLYRILYRKPSKHRKPPKISFAVTGAAAVTIVAVASGVAAAATEGPASKAASSRPATRVAVDSSSLAESALQLSQARAHVVKVELRKRGAEARRAAARAAARRRAAAAARRAAQLAAARQAQQQQQEQQEQQEQQPSAAPSNSATPSGSPQQIAMGMLGSFGWSSSEFSCLQSLWNAESGWNPTASNPTSGAYGIPQALPGSKMASAGADWQTNPATQIRWGLGYIKSTYGSPCAAWSHFQSAGSY
jgi:Transglycosylase SLT domain